MRPPQRNLGPGNDWGRWVEDQLQSLSTSATQAEQGNQRSFANNSAALKQLTNQLNAIPVASGYHDERTLWSVPANTTTSISTLSIPWTAGKTKCLVLAIASGGYDSYNSPMIPMAYRAFFRINIAGNTSPALPLIAQNMDTYAFVGSYSSLVTSGSDFDIRFQAINTSTYVASSAGFNRLNFDVITIFS